MQTVQLHQLPQALAADPQRVPVLAFLAGLLILTLMVIGIERAIDRYCARRDAKRNKALMLCTDPRQAKHMLSLYAQDDSADWLNNSAMRATRRQAKTLR